MNTPATYCLIGINLLVFAAESLRGGAASKETALRFGAQYTPYIQRGQWYRLFSSMFLHFGAVHLLCNMYSLFNLGPSLEYFFGIPIFLFLYLFSGLAGNLLTFFTELRSHRYALSLGASGAVFGLLGSYLVFALWPGYVGVSLYSVLRVLVINLVYTVSNKRINAMAHLGGLIGGVAVTAVLLLIFT
ncbi:MAG: rhomboid family intramembrane serine protease [Eubacteriales bacterium]|nr:rhomboid family intramembrane serine protease [Eubacteriales bacterium]